MCFLTVSDLAMSKALMQNFNPVTSKKGRDFCHWPMHMYVYVTEDQSVVSVWFVKSIIQKMDTYRFS